MDPALSGLPAPSHTGLNGAEKSFYTDSSGLRFRKSGFWLTQLLQGSYTTDLVSLCPLPAQHGGTFSILRTLVWPLCEGGKWKYLVALRVGTVCFPKGTNLYPFGIMGLILLLSHWAACVSLSLTQQISITMVKIAFGNFSLNITFSFAIYSHPPWNPKNSSQAVTWQGHSLSWSGRWSAILELLFQPDPHQETFLL